MAGGPFAPEGTPGITEPVARVVPEGLRAGVEVDTTVVAISNFTTTTEQAHPVGHENVYSWSS